MEKYEYEQEQIQNIIKWKNKEPSIVSSAFGRITAPLGWVAEKAIPESVIQAALMTSNSVGRFLADANDIIRDGGVTKISDLKNKDLELSDQLADQVHNWAIGMATIEGGVTGLGGVTAMTIDIPALITLSLRTIHKIGLCYGYEAKTSEDMDFVCGIIAVASANSMQEKINALLFLQQLKVAFAKNILEKMFTKKTATDLVANQIKTLARQIGINLSKRKALQMIPAIGALIGSSTNGWYIREIGWAARRMFQERWLLENERRLKDELFGL